MKKRVHYSIMEDMRKYLPDFNFEDYQLSYSTTDSTVIEKLRNYYDYCLPVDITAWIRVNEHAHNLIYAKGLGDQVCFVRDKLNPLLHPSYEVWDNTPPMVISTYYSKSVKLPVYQIKLEKYGLEIILRNNFYDWKVTVDSEIPLNYDFMGVFNPTEEVEPICCEGFPKDKIFGCYQKNHSEFTFETESRYDLYTFFFLLKNYFGIKKED